MGKFSVYWVFGNSVLDLSGNGDNGATLSNTSIVPGPHGLPARSLDGGTSSYITFGSTVETPSSGTVAFWIKFDSLTTGADGSGQHGIYVKTATHGGVQISYYDPNHTSPNAFGFTFRTTDGWHGKYSNAVPGGVKTGIWYHVVMVYDVLNAGTDAFYINGRPLGVASGTESTSGWNSNPSAISTIGYTGTSGSNFDGSIAEFAVFKSQLTAQQVAEYYKWATAPELATKLFSRNPAIRNIRVVPPRLLGTSALEPRHNINTTYFRGDKSLQGSWPLNTPAAPTDFSGNARHGTFVSGVAQGPGAFGMGYRFRGGTNTDAINLNFSTNYSSEFTIISWVHPRGLPSSGNRGCIVSKSSYYAASITDFPVSLSFGPSGAYSLALSKGDDYNGDAYVSIYPNNSSGTNLASEDFIPVIAVYKANSHAALYVDDKYEQTSINFTISTNSRNWTIGNDPFRQTAYGGFDGEISDVALLSRALSQAEVTNYIKWAKQRRRSNSTHLMIYDLVPAEAGGETNVTLEETLSIADTIDFGFNLGKVLSETLSINDTISTSKESSPAALQETLSITDAISYAKVFEQKLSESLGVTDSIDFTREFQQKLSETLGLTDTIISQLSISALLADTLSISDSISTSATRDRALQETLSITDSIDFDRERNELLQETLSIDDSIAFQLAVRSGKLSESIDLLDQLSSSAVFNRKLSEVLSLGDSLDFSYFSPNPKLSETLSITDTLLYERQGDLGLASLLSVNAALIDSEASKPLGINVLWPVVYVGNSLSINAPIGAVVDFVLGSDNVATTDDSSVYSGVFSIYRTVDGTLPMNVILPFTFDIVKAWSGSSLVISNSLLGSLDFDAAISPNRILEMDEVDSLLRGSNVIWGETLWNQGGGVNRTPSYLILLDGLDVTDAITECRISYSVDQFCGEIDITWANWDLFPNLDCSNLNLNFARERVQVFLEGKSIGKFFLEKRGVSTTFGKTTPTSWGRTTPAKLSLPYALPISKTWDTDTTAMQIAVELAGDVNISWEILDYQIRAGKFTMEEESPISGIQSLAAVVGGLVTTSRETGALIVRPKWRV